jgi:hypothetical protein
MPEQHRQLKHGGRQGPLPLTRQASCRDPKTVVGNRKAPASPLYPQVVSPGKHDPADIDLSKLIPFSKVPSMLPRSTRSGKRMSPAVCYRWASKGLNGVKLRSLKIGGTFHTSPTWLREFFEQVTAAELRGGVVEQFQADRAHARAERLLDAAGI